MSDTKFEIGAKVAFTTAGRYRTEQAGTVDGYENGWAIVRKADGNTVKTRPSTLRAG